MAFNIITIRDGEATEAALYPALSEDGEALLVSTEEADGQIQRLRIGGLEVLELKGDKRERLGVLKDTDVDVYITDARLVVACSKFTKGGGWHTDNYLDVTGYAIAGVANALSRARASRKRRGKCLVGQIRYPWLTKVGATSRTGIGTENALRLFTRDRIGDTTRTIILELPLDKRANAPELAQQIAHRCAAFRLAHDIGPGHEHRAAFEALATAPVLKPEPKRYAFHEMPTSFYVRADTAYPVRQSPSA